MRWTKRRTATPRPRACWAFIRSICIAWHGIWESRVPRPAERRIPVFLPAKKKATRIRVAFVLLKADCVFDPLVPHDRLARRRRLGSRSDRVERHQPFDWLLAQDVLAVELRHLRVLGVLFQFRLASAELLFARVLRDAQLLEGVVGGCVHMLLVQDQRVLRALHADLLAAGEDLMPSVLLVPLGERGRHVHLLDDVPPADAGVVRAEADLALL